MPGRQGIEAWLLVLGLILAGFVHAEDSTLDPRLNAAIELYRNEGAQAALPRFQQLSRQFSSGSQRRDHAAALHYIGESYWRLGHYDEAREFLGRALRLERASADRLAQGKTLNVLGLLDWDEGNYDQALRQFDAAGRIARELGDRRLEGASLNNAGLVHDELGDYDESLANYQAALAVYRDADFPRGVGDTLGNIGGTHLLLGRFREALGYYEQALAISERLDSKPAQSQDQGNIGLCLLGLGEVDAALARFDRALGLAHQAGMRQDEAYWTRHKANGFIQKGNYDAGLDAHRAALEVYEEIDAQAELLEGLHDMGRLHLLLGDAESAERYFSRALDHAHRIGLARGITRNLLALGDLETRRSRPGQAAELYEQARRRASESGERQLLAESLLRLAQLHRAQQQLDLASEEAGQALAVAREVEARAVVAEALYAQAESDRLHGRIAAALDGYDAAQVAIASSGDPGVLWQVHLGRARALESRGDTDGAIRALLAAVTLIEGVRNRLQEPRFRSGYIEDKYEVYLELVRLQLQRGQTAEAFTTAERLRARNYAELLGGRVAAPLSPMDRRREAELRQRIRQLQRAVEGDDGEAPPASRQRAMGRLLLELQVAEREYQAFLDDRGLGRTDSGLDGTLPALASIRDRLARDEALIEYIVGADSLTAFVVTSRGLAAKTTPVRRADLQSSVALLRDLVRHPGDDRWVKPARNLSRAVIDPLEDAGLLSGIRRLYVVPHGALNHLPFALLESTRSGQPRLLLDRYTVTYLPTAAVLVGMHPTLAGSHSMLAVAPARSRLRYAPEEASSVHALFQPNSRLLVGATATEGRFKQLAGEFSVLHLATHGAFNSLNPLLSGLEFEADAIEDGLLQIHEILALDLAADLVTLSACETALASGFFDDIPAADEFVGMTRAFLAAGSASVMATLWEIDDRASVQVMQRFYTHLRKPGADASAALALARTQRELRKTKELAHPYFWAPFVLAGAADGSGRQTLSKSGGLQ